MSFPTVNNFFPNNFDILHSDYNETTDVNKQEMKIDNEDEKLSSDKYFCKNF